MPDDARPYAPTPRKLRRARARGDVAKSPLLSASLALTAACAAVALGAEAFVASWGALVESLWSSAPAPGVALTEAATLWAGAIAAPLACASLAAAVGSLAQVGPLLAPRALLPDLSRLRPDEGLRRLLDPASLAGRLGPLAVGAALAGVGAWVLYHALAGLLGTVALAPATALAAAGHALASLVWRGCALLLLAGAVAYAYERWRHRERMKMSRRERAEEARQTAGDPAVRRRRARLRRERALSPRLEEAAASAALLLEGDRLLIAVAWSGAEDNPTVGVVARGPAADALGRLARRAPRLRDAALAARLASLEPGAAVPRAVWPRLAAALARAAA